LLRQLVDSADFNYDKYTAADEFMAEISPGQQIYSLVIICDYKIKECICNSTMHHITFRRTAYAPPSHSTPSLRNRLSSTFTGSSIPYRTYIHFSETSWAKKQFKPAGHYICNGVHWDLSKSRLL
jgi:hypothetical protein